MKERFTTTSVYLFSPDPNLCFSFAHYFPVFGCLAAIRIVQFKSGFFLLNCLFDKEAEGAKPVNQPTKESCQQTESHGEGKGRAAAVTPLGHLQ